VRAGAGISAGRSWTVRARAGPCGPELEFNGGDMGCPANDGELALQEHTQTSICIMQHFPKVGIFIIMNEGF